MSHFAAKKFTYIGLTSSAVEILSFGGAIMSNRKFGGTIGKGYYIALILCAVAIGISGYVYYRNQNNKSGAEQEVSVTVAATLPLEQEPIQAGATQPQQTDRETPPQTTRPAGKEKLQTVSPVQGQTIAVFSMDALHYNQTTRDWRVHNGMDIAADQGTSVCAAADGTVYTVFEDDTMGMTVVIRHANGYTTEYASLDREVSVAPGDSVKMGQTIGCVGQSALLESAIGDHVHFSVTCNGELVDPTQFLAGN